MNEYMGIYSYRINWAIFKAQWKMIFIILKLLLLIAHLALSLG